MWSSYALGGKAIVIPPCRRPTNYTPPPETLKLQILDIWALFWPFWVSQGRGQGILCWSPTCGNYLKFLHKCSFFGAAPRGYASSACPRGAMPCVGLFFSSCQSALVGRAPRGYSNWMAKPPGVMPCFLIGFLRFVGPVGGKMKSNQRIQQRGQ